MGLDQFSEEQALARDWNELKLRAIDFANTKDVVSGLIASIEGNAQYDVNATDDDKAYITALKTQVEGA